MKHLTALWRSFLKAMFFVAASPALRCIGSFAGENNRPNVFFIMSNDDAAPSISAYGGIMASGMAFIGFTATSNTGGISRIKIIDSHVVVSED
jgi:hypothetical protein